MRGLKVEIEPPKFDENDNPNQFLEKLDKFFTAKGINENNGLDILDASFEGRVRIWFETQRVSFDDYNDFKNKFLSEFYLIPIRVKIKSNWLQRKFEGSKETLVTYFQRQVQEAQYILPKMEDYEIFYTIVSQMPIRVREAMVTVDFNSYNKVSQSLTQLDFTFHDKLFSHKKSNSQLEQNSLNRNGSNNVDSQNKIKMRKLNSSQNVSFMNYKYRGGGIKQDQC